MLLQGEDGRFLPFTVKRDKVFLHFIPNVQIFERRLFKLDSFHILAHLRSENSKISFYTAKLFFIDEKKHITVYLTSQAQQS